MCLAHTTTTITKSSWMFELFDKHNHGTRCAGQISATKNDVCGIGIAYESRVVVLRVFSDPISYIDEATTLNNADICPTLSALNTMQRDHWKVTYFDCA